MESKNRYDLRQKKTEIEEENGIKRFLWRH